MKLPNVFHKHKKRQGLTLALNESERLAIQAQESLVNLGYKDKIKPLNLRNHFSKISVFFAIVTALLYGISGFYSGHSSMDQEGIEFFSDFDGLAFAALISAVSSVTFIVLTLTRKHTRKIGGYAALIVLISGSLLLNIFGVVIGILIH